MYVRDVPELFQRCNAFQLKSSEGCVKTTENQNGQKNGFDKTLYILYTVQIVAAEVWFLKNRPQNIDKNSLLFTCFIIHTDVYCLQIDKI